MQKEILAAVKKHCDFILENYGIEIYNVLTVRFDLKGKAAGKATHFLLEERFEVRLNLEAGLEFLLTDTIPHEMAHVLQGALGSKLDHGRAWEFYCKQLGGTGLMYHQLDLTPARKSRAFLYLVEGEEFILSTIRHNKVQNKVMEYISNATGNTLNKQHFIQEVTNES